MMTLTLIEGRHCVRSVTGESDLPLLAERSPERAAWEAQGEGGGFSESRPRRCGLLHGLLPVCFRRKAGCGWSDLAARVSGLPGTQGPAGGAVGVCRTPKQRWGVQGIGKGSRGPGAARDVALGLV